MDELNKINNNDLFAEVARRLSPNQNQPENNQPNQPNQPNDNTEIINKLNETKKEYEETKKREQEKQGIIDKFKDALGLGKKKETPPEDPKEIIDRLNKKNEETPNETEKNNQEKQEVPEDRQKEKVQHDQKIDKDLLKIIDGLQKKVAFLEERDIARDQDEFLDGHGLKTKEQKKLFDFLYEDYMEGKPKDHNVPTNVIQEMVEKATSMSNAQKAVSDKIQTQNLHKQWQQSNNLNIGNGIYSNMTTEQFDNLTLGEREDLHKTNPLLYKHLLDQSIKRRGLRVV